MKISSYDTHILRESYAALYESYRNVQCLFLFLKENYPEVAKIEYTIFLKGVIRMYELEGVLGKTLGYPVFAKEIEMADDIEDLKELLKTRYNLACYGYQDPTLQENVEGRCIASDLGLYEIKI